METIADHFKHPIEPVQFDEEEAFEEARGDGSRVGRRALNRRHCRCRAAAAAATALLVDWVPCVKDTGDNDSDADGIGCLCISAGAEEGRACMNEALQESFARRTLAALVDRQWWRREQQQQQQQLAARGSSRHDDAGSCCPCRKAAAMLQQRRSVAADRSSGGEEELGDPLLVGLLLLPSYTIVFVRGSSTAAVATSSRAELTTAS